MAKNKKMTRNSYKRKIIVLGIMIFMSIALVTTGFAAWVISRNATNDDATGDISVGTVNQNTITFIEESIEFYTEKGATASENVVDFKFEPVKGDSTGLVRANATEYELITLTVKGQLTGLQHLKVNGSGESVIKVKLDLREALGIVDAATNQYINDKLTFKQGSGAQVVTQQVAFDEFVEIKVSAVSGQDDTGEFEFTVAFSWGSTFGGMNPSEYYDLFATMDSYLKANHATTYNSAKQAFAEKKHGKTFDAFKLEAGNAEKTVDDFFNEMPGTLSTLQDEFKDVLSYDEVTIYEAYVTHVVSTLEAFHTAIDSNAKYTVILVAEPK